jgi:glycerol kinase
MQFQSELLRTAVVRPRVTETTALGAAALAGLAVGFWKDKGQVGALAGRDRTFRPRLAPAKLRSARRQWSRAVDTARHWSAQ